MNGARREHGYLDVPYAERGQAKRLGARWDPAECSWWTATPGLAAFQRWARLPTILAGEDRGFGKGLFADPIPASSWYRNVRSAVSERDWYRVSQMVRRRAGWRCEACGMLAASPQDRALLDAHERFSYDECSGIQALRRLICLCAACHGVTHFGDAALREWAQGVLGLVTKPVEISKSDGGGSVTPWAS